MAPGERADEAPEVPAGVVAQLLFDFLRQLSTLSLAGAGGTVTLLQTVFADSEQEGLLVAGAAVFFLAALFALQTQQVFVERLAAETRTLRPHQTAIERFSMARTPRTERVLTYVSFALFGVGVGAVMMALALEFAAGL